MKFKVEYRKSHQGYHFDTGYVEVDALDHREAFHRAYSKIPEGTVILSTKQVKEIPDEPKPAA